MKPKTRLELVLTFHFIADVPATAAADAEQEHGRAAPAAIADGELQLAQLQDGQRHPQKDAQAGA